MAYETGTATSARDLFNKLQTFLKTNADLVTASQEWTEVWTGTTAGVNVDDVMLSGPGLSGTSQVLIGMRLFEDVTNDRYHIRLSGATGVVPSSDAYDDHANSTPVDVYMPLDAGTMTYWFVANGNRFVVVAKISTVFESMYGGFFLPYADPVAYPYPMFIGGSAGDYDGGSARVDDWRDASVAHTNFTAPRYRTGTNTYGTSAFFLNPAGLWITCTNRDSSSDGDGRIGPITHNGTWQYEDDQGAISNTWFYPAFQYGRMREAYGGDFPLWAMPLSETNGPTTYGVLDGISFTQQFGNAAENTITIGGTDHLVVQNVFRTTELDYWALKLE